MIAARLIQRIEANWDKIAQKVIDDRNAKPELQHYRSLSDEEIRIRARDLATRLGQWLTDENLDVHRAYFESIGRRRFEEGVPVHELVLKINIIKRAIRQYASEQNFSLTPMEIYEELELLRAMAGFFDSVVFRMVKGYEEARREAEEANTTAQAAAA
jgi:hypothetical protein